MNKYRNDSRIVLTLDAGGTNMVFGAMLGEDYLGTPITLPANADNLDLCLRTIVLGFEMVV
ncbi:MAG: ROK family protein, partial [Bacteroidales bacterium]|nr:ROK family protein [Bacteroidales bacterium]